jgi:phosphoglycolate phosphatase
MATRPYDLLIFDWDGTLMDSAARIVACLQAGVQQAGLPARSDAELRHIIGLGLQQAIDYLYPEGVPAESKQKMVEVYRHQFLYANPTPSCLFEGVAAMLANLETEGYLLAIATGKSRQGLNHVLQEVGLERRFHTSRCADETASKPDPAMLREILVDLDIAPARALMIGDTQFDIELAKNAGVDAVAVAHGAHDTPKLLEKEPLVILEHITYLLSWLPSRSTWVARQSLP